MVLFIGNLNKATTESELKALLSGFGTIIKLKLMADRITRRSRGYAFVDMENSSDAQMIITKLHTLPFMGNALAISIATPNQLKADWT
jgi:RNA-binding proteins (RRM domain)